MAESDLLSKNCCICGSDRLYYQFSLEGQYRVVKCSDCSFMTLNPQPSQEALNAIYSKDYFLLDRTPEGEQHFRELKKKTADYYLDLLAEYGVSNKGRLLEIGCGEGDFSASAADRGFYVTAVEYNPHSVKIAQEKLGTRGKVFCGEISLLDQQQEFDVCILSDVLEHVRDPNAFLQKVWSLLSAKGVIFIACPSLDSWSAKLQKENWVEFKPEHLHYFKTKNLMSILLKNGFGDILQWPGKKTLSFDYVAGHFEKFPSPFFSTFFSVAKKVIPRGLGKKPISLIASGTIMLAHKKELQQQKKLSVVMPAYNEATTIKQTIERVLHKEIRDVKIELIIVESNSTDGTKEIVQSYANHPCVRVVFEDSPKGKGHAVRTGFKHASGDYILIQDADSEYDIEDYDVLVDPLINGRQQFVLGSRHGGKTWRLRAFKGAPIASVLLNLGHVFFASLVNILFGLRLKDPFTMYKVFVRDCLYGLQFDSNRFDFDFELLIKLVRKGYRPIEIPVNYRSRSFEEGKKVRVFADPMTWIVALVKYRFQKRLVVPPRSIESFPLGDMAMSLDVKTGAQLKSVTDLR